MRNKKSRKVAVLEALSRGFTQRTLSAGYMDDPESRKAYGEYFGTVGFEKGVAISREIRNRNLLAFEGKKRLSMVDLGTGTGEFVRGLSEGFLPENAAGIDLLCVDRSMAVLQDFSDLWSPSGPIRLRLLQALLPETKELLKEVEGGIDLLSMANLLAENEARLPEFRELLATLFIRLSPGGMMVLVEPADKRSSRSLLSLGDDLMTLFPELRVDAPCPNDRRGPCPALDDPGDWCHEDRPMAFSSALTRTAASLGHVKDSLKMTYLLLSRREGRVEGDSRPTLRLVSPLHKEKGLSWGLFCDGRSLIRLRLLNRNRDRETQSFGRLRRGDTLIDPRIGGGLPASPEGPFVEWPAGRPVVGVQRPDGAPWNAQTEEG